MLVMENIEKNGKKINPLIPLILGILGSSMLIIGFFVLFAFITPSSPASVDLQPLVLIERLALADGNSSISVSPGPLTYLLTAIPAAVGTYFCLKLFWGSRKSWQRPALGATS